MKTIVPTSCIAVAGQQIRQWRKLYRNKINMFGHTWTEHVYNFTPVGLGFAERNLSNYQKKDPYEIRIYRNSSGGVIWVTQINPNGFFCNDYSPEIHKDFVGYKGGPAISNYHGDTTWVGWKKEWKRSYSDVKFLLTFERTREDFLKKIQEGRETYLLYTSKEVEEAVYIAYHKAQQGQGCASIGTYSGPASLSTEELKALGLKVCHRPPTKKYPEMAPGNHVVENFNWGAPTPKKYQWFRYGAGYHYHGTKGCNSGWVWYD